MSFQITSISFIFVVLLLLKVLHVIDWSWWLVTLPLWGGLAMGVGFLLFLGAMAALIWVGGRLNK